jgi:YaiO family outer membrane protein
MRNMLLIAAALLPFSATAHAQPRFNLKSVVASVDTDYVAFTGAYGKWRATNIRSQIKAGDTRVDLALSQGRRSAGDTAYNASRAQVSIAHDWTAGLTTRTYGTIASNSPVFVNREIGQEFNLKPDAATVLTLGSRYSRYFGASDSWSWSAGAARYFPGGYVSYRFSAYNTSGLGHTTGHTIGAKLSDPYGSTQAWVGFGSQLRDADWLSSPQKGHQTQVEVRRLQPILKGVALSVGAKQAWIESIGTRYIGTGFHIGLELHAATGLQNRTSD